MKGYTPYKKALLYKSRRRYTTQYSKAEQYIIKLLTI